MRLIWELFVNMLQVFILSDFLIRYFGFKNSAPAFRYGSSVLFFVSDFAAISVLSSTAPFETASAAATAALMIIFSVAALKGSAFEKIFISLMAVSTAIITASFTGFVLSIIRGSDTVTIFSVLDPVRMAAMLISQLLLFTALRLMLYLRHNSGFTFTEFMLLLLLPSLSLAAMTVLIPSALDDRELQLTCTIVVIIIAVMNIIACILFVHICRSNRLRETYSLLKFQYESEQKRAEDIKELYLQIRSMRHDMKNHLSTVNILASQDKCSEIYDYTSDLINDNSYINRIFIFTGNDLLDAVVNMKFSIAENLGISCSAHIDRDIGTGMPFRPADTSVLLGNLLDNALEAAAASERKLMLLNIVNRNGSLYIIVSNTIAASVLDNNPKLQTSKPDKELHGFGTKNINKIVRSYNGIINYSEDGDIFNCDILIPFLRS